MDPYLEDPGLWPDVHHGIIEMIRGRLSPLLRPRYRIALEKRTYLAEPEGLAFVGRPDLSVVGRAMLSDGPRPPSHADVPGRSDGEPQMVTLPCSEAVEEAYLEARDVGTGEVVAVLEVLSPSNKRVGAGRDLYAEKRQRVLGSRTHLVEIDFLRAGDPMPLVGGRRTRAYSILISRSHDRPTGSLYAFGLRVPIPRFSLPLRRGDAEPELDLQDLLRELYDTAGYDLAVDYTKDPVPPLDGDDAVWALDLLRATGLR